MKNKRTIEWIPVGERLPRVEFDYMTEGFYDNDKNHKTEVWSSETLLISLESKGVTIGDYSEFRTYDISQPSSIKLIDESIYWYSIVEEGKVDDVLAWALLPDSYKGA